MSKREHKNWAGCPTRYAAGILGDRWIMVILRDILLHGKRRYGEFARSEEGISTNILATRLSALEETGMVRRVVDPAKASSVLYLPTQKGLDFVPALLGVMRWSVKYDGATEAPPTFAASIDEDPVAAAQYYIDKAARIDADLLNEG